MGATFLYKCNQCSYEADVSGGEDCGMLTRTQTIVCHSCMELMDVATGPTELAVEAQEEKDRKDPLECNDCAGRNVSPVEKPLKCPKCNGEMAQGNMMTLWD